MMVEVTHTNPFEAAGGRSSRGDFDERLRLALGRGLAAAYADVMQEPLPEPLKAWLHRLESGNGANREGGKGGCGDAG
jgi:hypothetical protein